MRERRAGGGAPEGRVLLLGLRSRRTFSVLPAPFFLVLFGTDPSGERREGERERGEAVSGEVWKSRCVCGVKNDNKGGAGAQRGCSPPAPAEFLFSHPLFFRNLEASGQHRWPSPTACQHRGCWCSMGCRKQGGFLHQGSPRSPSPAAPPRCFPLTLHL